MENQHNKKFSLIEKFFKISPEDRIWRLSYFLRHLAIWFICGIIIVAIIVVARIFIENVSSLQSLKVWIGIMFLAFLLPLFLLLYCGYVLDMKRFADLGEKPKQLKYFYIINFILVIFMIFSLIGDFYADMSEEVTETKFDRKSDSILDIVWKIMNLFHVILFLVLVSKSSKK